MLTIRLRKVNVKFSKPNNYYSKNPPYLKNKNYLTQIIYTQQQLSVAKQLKMMMVCGFAHAHSRYTKIMIWYYPFVAFTALADLYGG